MNTSKPTKHDPKFNSKLFLIYILKKTYFLKPSIFQWDHVGSLLLSIC